jgi:hypothetical protein
MREIPWFWHRAFRVAHRMRASRAFENFSIFNAGIVKRDG